jgi:hypothetical protein
MRFSSLAGNIEHFLDEFLVAGSRIVSQDDKLRRLTDRKNPESGERQEIGLYEDSGASPRRDRVSFQRNHFGATRQTTNVLRKTGPRKNAKPKGKRTDQF